MANQSFRRIMYSLFAAVYAVTLLYGVEPMRTAAMSPDDIKAFVSFEQAYLDAENFFTVWGQYSGKTEESIQIISAVYDRSGKLVQTKLGEKVTLAPQESFTIDGEITLDESVDVEEAVLKVFIWDSMSRIQALGQAFSLTDKSFTYTLDAPARTSAGVFDEDGTLIRTLWGGEEEEAGVHTKTWDGFDDNGNLMQDGTYTVTVMENNVAIKADAFVGNTSDHGDFDYVISGFANFLSDMVYVDGKVFYIYPYSEGRPSIYYFNTDNPDRMAGEFGTSNQSMQRGVTDGKRLYFINTEHGKDLSDDMARTFVYAYELNTQRMYMFEDNGQWMSGWGVDNLYYGVNVLTHFDTLYQTGGLGVQTDGDLLFVSYVSENKVYVMNKNTGIVLNSYTVNTPITLTYSDNGGLWVGSKQDNGRYKAERYFVGADGTLNPDPWMGLEDDFEDLIRMEVSPDGKRVVVAVGETNQYKMYDVETGKVLWTFGNGESYEEDPTVYQDKLMLTNLAYAEFENDTTLWVGDPGNNRAYKLDLSGGEPEIVDMIMMQPGSHSLGLDAANPANVYSNALQYEMDYQKSGQDSWRLVKNWKEQVGKYGIDTVSQNQFNNVITLPNGRTYFSANYDGGVKLFYFENDHVGYTGFDFNNKVMLDDGVVGSIVSENGMAYYRLHRITGYNENNDPIFDEKGEVVATLSTESTNPVHVFGSMKLNMPITENNVMITLRSTMNKNENDKKTMHLGGVQLGEGIATDWKWKTSSEGSEFYDGNFPSDGTFETGNGVWNTAQKVVANGKNIVFQYNGEFYRQAQTNKLYFYRDNGLLVGVFGDAAFQQQLYENVGEYGKELFASNAFDMYFVQDPDNTDRAYIMQNSENGKGNFKYNVVGLDSIKEHTIKINLKNTIWNGLAYTYYVGDTTNPNNCVTREWRDSVSRESYTEGDDFVMRYTGYIKNPNESRKLKLFIETREMAEIKIDGKQIFNQTGHLEPELDLEPGRFYSFSCEVKKSSSTSGGKTRLLLEYYDMNGQEQLFTQDDFRTDPIPYTDSSVLKTDFLEGLPFASEIRSGTYGITRNPDIGNTGVSVNTNSINPSFDDVRDIRFQANLWQSEGGLYPTSAWFTKNLGMPSENLTSWELDTEVARAGYLNYGELGNPENSTGIHVDVLDVNDKVIARFYWAMENKTYGNNEFIYQSQNLYNNNITSELYGVPTNYVNDFNTPSPLKISAENGLITFEYYGQKVTTPVMEEGADWSKPAKLKADAFYTYGRTNAREMNMSFSKLVYTQYLAQ